MTAAAAALQRSVFQALSGDAALGLLLGGAKVFDGAPTGTPLPYVSFGRASAFDWSTTTEEGTEVLFSLHVWSRGKGAKEAQAIMERVGARLRAGLGALDGHRLINLRLVSGETRFDEKAGVEQGTMRFRAVLEPQG